MYITIKMDVNFDWLMENCWSGALNTLDEIWAADKEDEFLQLLEEIGLEDLTAINDYLWFDSENIYEMLGIESEE